MKRACLFFSLALAAGVISPYPAQADTPAAVKELKEREAKIQATVAKVMPAIVCITSETRPGSGSGIIINKEGLILTAAHVTEATGDNIIITFPDGRRVKGKALGANRTTDAALAKITEESKDGYPFVEMGSSDLVNVGDWCIAMGHPGGFSIERKPPVRLGRIWQRDYDGAIFADCTLIGGDSGGPLFDLDGKVIGIHSSIGKSLAQNRHVAIDTFRADWDEMLEGKNWGELKLANYDPDRPATGAVFDRDVLNPVRVIQVSENSPAERAGLKENDLVLKLNATEVANVHAFLRNLGKRKVGEKLQLVVKRDGKEMDVELQLARREDIGKKIEVAAEKAPAEPKLPDTPKGPKPYLGLAVESSLDGASVKISSITPDSPAAKAGLQTGDTLLKAGDKTISLAADVADQLSTRKAGDKLSLTVKRGDKEVAVEVTLEEKKSQ